MAGSKSMRTAPSTIRQRGVNRFQSSGVMTETAEGHGFVHLRRGAPTRPRVAKALLKQHWSRVNRGVEAYAAVHALKVLLFVVSVGFLTGGLYARKAGNAYSHFN